jgi:hypothetical protein
MRSGAGACGTQLYRRPFHYIQHGLRKVTDAWQTTVVAATTRDLNNILTGENISDCETSVNESTTDTYGAAGRTP